MQLWHALSTSVTPKAHITESHVADKIPVKTSEEWVERLHQQHLRDMRRVRNLREKAKQFSHISRWEQANRSPKIEKVIEGIKKSRELPEATKEKRMIGVKRKREEKVGTNIMTRLEDREEIRIKTMHEFQPPTNRLPTAMEENIRENR